MTIAEVTISIGIGVISGLVTSGLIWLWVFRRRVRKWISTRNISVGESFGWLMAFTMLTVIIVFPLIGLETPDVLYWIVPMTAMHIIVLRAWRRR